MEKLTVQQIATNDPFEVERFFEEYILRGQFSTVEQVTKQIRAAARFQIRAAGRVSEYGIKALEAYTTLDREQFTDFV